MAFTVQNLLNFYSKARKFEGDFRLFEAALKELQRDAGMIKKLGSFPTAEPNFLLFLNNIKTSPITINDAQRTLKTVKGHLKTLSNDAEAYEKALKKVFQDMRDIASGKIKKDDVRLINEDWDPFTFNTSV